MTTFFSSTFTSLTVIDIHFLYLKIIKIHFHVVRPLVHSGLHNTCILEVKAVRLEFCPV